MIFRSKNHLNLEHLENETFRYLKKFNDLSPKKHFLSSNNSINSTNIFSPTTLRSNSRYEITFYESLLFCVLRAPVSYLFLPTSSLISQH